VRGVKPTAGSNPAFSASKQANTRLRARFFVLVFHLLHIKFKLGVRGR